MRTVILTSDVLVHGAGDFKKGRTDMAAGLAQRLVDRGLAEYVPDAPEILGTTDTALATSTEVPAEVESLGTQKKRGIFGSGKSSSK